MKRNVSALIASFAMAGTFVAAQSSTPPTSTQPQSPATTQQPRTPSAGAGQQDRSASSAAQEMTLTGCLVQGSSPTVFILENAKSGAASSASGAASSASAASTAEGKSYVLASNASVDLRAQLNRQVRIVGTPDSMSSMSSPAASSSSGPSVGSSTAPGAGSSNSSGSGAARTPSAGAASSSSSVQSAGASSSAQERDLPKLTAKTVTRVADTCAS